MSSKPTSDDLTAYPKIPSPFLRDHTTKLLTDQWSSEALDGTKDLPWVWSEKVDGTNIRVIWDGYRVTFAGRTLRAQLPIPLHTWLVDHFGGPEKEQLFEQKFGATPAVLYGEGYGAGIQNGGRYRSDMAVVLFDVLVGDRWWLYRDDVRDVAHYFGIGVVPAQPEAMSLVDQLAIFRAGHGIQSAWGLFPAEGLVGTPAAGLRDRAGERIAVKLKTRDLVPNGTEQ